MSAHEIGKAVIEDVGARIDVGTRLRQSGRNRDGLNARRTHVDN